MQFTVSTSVSQTAADGEFGVLTIPASLDETRLAVADYTGVIAEMTWRPPDNYQPGPATWDWELHRLGYDRRSPWQPEPVGFGCRGRAHR